MSVLRITGPIREIRERERRLVENLDLERIADERLRGWVTDTFDGRLGRDGGLIERREQAHGAELVWTDLDLVGERGRLHAVPELPILAPSLPPGPVGERLAALLGERALIGIGHLKRRRTSWHAHDEQGKTVLRVFVESAIEFAPIEGRARRRLPAQILVEALRGYEAAFDRAREVIANWRGIEIVATAFGAELLALAGLRPGHDPSALHFEIAAPLRAEEGYRRVLLALLEVIAANRTGAAAALDPEFLHDLRVAVRRTRTLLSAAEDVLGDRDRVEFAAEFKWFGGETSWLRDLDVHLLHFDDLVARAEHADDHAFEPLRSLLREHQQRERARVASVLTSARTLDLIQRWRSFLQRAATLAGARADAPLAEIAVERVRHAERRVLRLGRTIDAASPDERLHELRKRAKKLRYLLEFFGDVIDTHAARARIAELKTLQDLLGAHQDRAVQIVALEGHAAELAGAAPATHLAIRALAAGLDRDRRALRAEFAARFGAYDARGARRAFRDALDRVAPRCEQESAPHAPASETP